MSKKIKRFYTKVEMKSVDAVFQVELDERSVKSAGQKILQLPHEKMAEQLASEWRQQEEFIDFATMPIMQFASSVTDNIISRPADAQAEILKYAHSDLLCYRVAEPDSLVDRQKQQWDPVLLQFKNEQKIEFLTSVGIQYVEQGGENMSRFGALINPLEGYQLGSVHLITVMTGSAILAIALYKGMLTSTAVWDLAHLDEDFQAEHWGEDEEASSRRARRYIEFLAAALVFDR